MKKLLTDNISTTLSLIFPMPPKLNQQIREARTNRYKSAETKTQWTNDIAVIAISDSKEVKFPEKVWLTFSWEVKTLNNDPDNIAAAAKYIMDGLVIAGIIKDDSLAYIGSPIIHYYAKAKTEQVTIRISSVFIGL